MKDERACEVERGRERGGQEITGARQRGGIRRQIAESREQRAGSREQRVEREGQREESREQQAARREIIYWVEKGV